MGDKPVEEARVVEETLGRETQECISRWSEGAMLINDHIEGLGTCLK